MILGAALSAVASKDNPFADQYRRSIEHDKPSHIARRIVARTMANVLCGMWKTQTEYRPDWVGVSASELDNRP